MAIHTEQRVQQLKSAIEELRGNREHFSDAAFSQILLLLLEKLRQLQTHDATLATSDEIRLVSVMFVDVKDSVQLAQRMETSDWKNLLDHAHRRVAERVTEWSGQVGQYLGDGLLCFFGAQRSAGDDALHAVSCALDIQNDMRAYARELRARYNIPFGVRIGISTGQVVVGMIGAASKQELLALGPSTNLAARLQSVADAGEILVDQTTYNRVRKSFVMQVIPAVELKGYEEPMNSFMVIGRRVQPRTRLTETSLNGIDLPFAGRDDLLRYLRDQRERILKNEEAQCFTVIGEIGMGKSRLLQWMLLEAEDTPFTPVVMIASYERRSVTHHLLRDLLLSQCSLSEDASPEQIHQRVHEYFRMTWDAPDAPIAAEVIGFLAGLGFEDSPHVQPLLRRRGVEISGYPWVLRWLRVLADNSALLLVVENLQWADPASVELLNYLARELAYTPTLLLAATRPGFAQDYPNYLRGIAHHQRIHLEPLPALATQHLVAAVLSRVTHAPHALIDTISARAEGNPLFVLEFLGMLFDSGVITPDPAGWRFDLLRYEGTLNRLPSGLIGVVQVRLDELEAQARHTLQVAAVVGPTFWETALHNLGIEAPAEILNGLAARGIIVPVGESAFEGERQFAFRHTLYRDVAYEMLPRAKREAYHRDVTRWLLPRLTEKPEFYALLAEQYQLGGQVEPALATYAEAARNRYGRGLHKEAVLLIDRALGLAGQVPRTVALPLTSQLWTLRGQALNALGRFEEASAASRSALMLLRELPDEESTEMRVRAARSLGSAYRSLGRYDEAALVLNEAYEALLGDDDPLLASVLRAFGTLCLYQGRLSDSLAYQQRAYQHAMQANDQTQITATMTQLGQIALERGNLATALGYFEQVLEINYARGYAHYQAQDLRSIGMVYRALHAEARALTVLEEARMLQESIGFEDPITEALSGVCLIALGQPEAGLQALHGAAERGHQDVHSARLLQLTQIEGLYLAHDILAAHERALILAHEMKDRNPLLHGRALYFAGLCALALGDPGAQSMLQQALDLELEYGGRDAWRVYEALARAVSDPDERDQHRRSAAAIIQATSGSLFNRPDLQYSFIHHPAVQAVLDLVQA